MSKRAFTLIELLVVIAIIAILAAILFPVFAQAKTAAKKTADLSNQKQLATAFQIYLSDYDDQMPGAYRVIQTTDGPQTQPTHFFDVPANWDPTVSGDAAYVESVRHAWANAIQPYVKNIDMYQSPGAATKYAIPGWNYAPGGYATVNYIFNGLLSYYSGTAITEPTKLRLLTSTYGNRSTQGAGLSAPHMSCPSTGVCRFVPSSPSCNGANGTYSELGNPSGASMWMFGQGMNAVFADTHARFQKVAGGATNASDYRTDFWARYNANGVAQYAEWQDTNFCHTMLFMPDFDFSNFGTPILY